MPFAGAIVAFRNIVPAQLAQFRPHHAYGKIQRSSGRYWSIFRRNRRFRRQAFRRTLGNADRNLETEVFWTPKAVRISFIIWGPTLRFQLNVAARILNTGTLMPDSKTRSRDDLLLWMDALEAYALDWDKTFEHKASYFTQEFWYLLVRCMINDWNGTPLSVSGACQQMKSGSNRTRESRIRKAVADGYLVKRQGESDRREAIVVPSKELETMMIGHFSRTLSIVRERLRELNID